MKKLRLVSRHIADGISKVYKKTFFTDVKVFVATKWSMQTAIKIMDSANLGPLVRRLVLVDDGFLDTNARRREPRRCSEELAQRTMRLKGEDLTLLTELFRKFQRPGIPSTIHLKAYVQDEDGPARGFNNLKLRANDVTFLTVMRAIVLSGASFDSFTMDTTVNAEDDFGKDNFSGIRVGAFEQDEYQTFVCIAAFHRFKILDLILQAGEDQTDFVGEDLISILPHSKIRSLTIRPELDTSESTDDCDGQLLETLFKFDFPAMESFTLRKVVIDWEPLASFLARQEKLRCLGFSRMSVSRVPVEIAWSVDSTGVLEEDEVCKKLHDSLGLADFEFQDCVFDNRVAPNWW
ncbi:hypothetical protein TI39_contig600g00002 [Zymoseptoria brevis]|uniref:Uncharacterized protein n=1 Tax=Zymoseptoria brevis TaxID=1047168 RepID=A0A0F4GKT4_9PEZI|nr:hypothetical protein TI39_contig600g00002 [Zymoseptoria brevis]